LKLEVLIKFGGSYYSYKINTVSEGNLKSTYDSSWKWGFTVCSIRYAAFVRFGTSVGSWLEAVHFPRIKHKIMLCWKTVTYTSHKIFSRLKIRWFRDKLFRMVHFIHHVRYTTWCSMIKLRSYCSKLVFLENPTKTLDAQII